MSAIHFSKMHGCGNDYIYVNTITNRIDDPSRRSIEWSDRHKGIGADGLVLIGEPEGCDADFSMRIFNADGSEAMMCGNASRCVGKYVYERGLTRKTEIKLQTLSGIKTLFLHVNGSVVESVTVDMLQPKLEDENLFIWYQAPCHGTFVSMGNPHFVVFTPDVNDVEKFGPLWEHYPAFPQRCNIEFAHINNDGTIRTRVWERGSGITLACGTGACATAVASVLKKGKDRTSQIVMDGGTLSVEWRESDNHVYLTGDAQFVFDGTIGTDD